MGMLLAMNNQKKLCNTEVYSVWGYIIYIARRMAMKRSSSEWYCVTRHVQTRNESRTARRKKNPTNKGIVILHVMQNSHVFEGFPICLDKI